MKSQFTSTMILYSTVSRRLNLKVHVITHETVNVHVWKILFDFRSFTKFISDHVLDLGSLKARDSASLTFSVL